MINCEDFNKKKFINEYCIKLERKKSNPRNLDIVK